MKILKVCGAIALLAAMVMAQSAVVPSGIVSTGGTGTWTTLMSCNSNLCGASRTFSDNNSTWIPAETRKPKSPLMTIAMVRKNAHSLAPEALAPAAYLKLANSIGLTSAATDEARMLQAIADVGAKVFNWASVDEYLYEQVLKQSAHTRWVWKPMRESDIEPSKENAWREVPNLGLVYSAQYGQPIPERVLNTVAKMLEKMPDAVFLVSDYEVVKPDPFLAVSTKRMLAQGKIYVIDNWDEPGYVDKSLVKTPAASAPLHLSELQQTFHKDGGT